MNLRSTTLCLIMALAFALPAPAVDLSADAETIDAQREQWTERIRRSSEAVANAKARLAQAEAEYTRMRTRNRARGDRRVQYRSSLQAAEKALTEAEAALDATLEAARNESVPPGWIRDATSGQPAAPADTRR